MQSRLDEDATGGGPVADRILKPVLGEQEQPGGDVEDARAPEGSVEGCRFAVLRIVKEIQTGHEHLGGGRRG